MLTYMSTWLELSVVIFDAVLIVEFVTQYNGYKANARKHKFWGAITIIALFINSVFFSANTDYDLGLMIRKFIILMIYGFFVLRGGAIRQLASILCFQAGYIIINTLVLMITATFWDFKNTELLGQYHSSKMIVLAAAKMIIFYYSRALLFLKNRDAVESPKSLWWIILLIPTLTIMTMTLIMKTVELYPLNTLHLFYLMASVMGALMINVAAYYLFHKAKINYAERLETQLLKQGYEVQEIHNREIRGIRHDMNNQLLSIRQLAKMGRLEEIIRQTDILVDHLEETCETIQTKDFGLNSIVNVKLSECIRRNIKGKCNIEGDPSNFLESCEWASLLGNLLDNAIEAAEKCEGEKTIEIVLRRHANFLKLVITNTISATNVGKNTELVTTKGDRVNHGFGIKNVNEIVRRHNGKFYREIGDGMFIVKILFPTSA